MNKASLHSFIPLIAGSVGVFHLSGTFPTCYPSACLMTAVLSLPAAFLTFDAVQLVLLNRGFAKQIHCDERVCEVLTIDL